MALGSAPYSLVQSFLEEKALAAFDGSESQMISHAEEDEESNEGEDFLSCLFEKGNSSEFLSPFSFLS